MKIATIHVYKCIECPHYRNVPNDADECFLMSFSANPGDWKLVPPKNGIPFWCPLPDKENKEEKSG